MLSLQNRITVNSVRRSISSAFSIAHSFLLDGFDEYFNLVKTPALSGVLSGDCEFTILASLYRLPKTGIISILDDFSGSTFSINLRQINATQVEFNVSQGGVGKISTINVPDMDDRWVNLAVTFKSSNTSSLKFFMDNVEVSISSSNHINADVNSVAHDYNIGRLGNSSNYFKGYINQLGVVDRLITLQEYQNWNNGGKAKSITSVFGNTDTAMDMNPDNSTNTAQFVWTDTPNGLTATSLQMEDIDKTTFTPY